MATRGGWRPYFFTSYDFDCHESKLSHVHHILDKFSLTKNIVTALCINMSLDSI